MEWPELLRRQAESLRQYASWLDTGCQGDPPAAVDATAVRGPIPFELRRYATELAAQTVMMHRCVAERLAALRRTAGHPAPVRNGYEDRPMPRYLDAMG